jgi:hypothetical protein
MIPARMAHWTATFPYLASALVLGALAVLHAAFYRDRACETGLIALLGLPFAIYSFEFIPQYWNPRLVLWLGPCSLEDLLFAASTGVIAWACATRGTPAQPRLAGWHWRLLGIYALGVGTGYLLKYTLPHPNVMNSTMAGILLSAVIMLALRRDLWPLMLRGGLGFGLAYAVFLKLALLLLPGFLAQWNPAVPFGYCWGMPVYELLWALAFGAVWPLYLAYGFGYRLPGRVAKASQG